MLTAAQACLYAYILKRISHVEHAKDILQEVNLVLFRKKSDFKAGTKFLAWAYTVAHFQLLSHLQKNKKNHLLLGEHIINQFADCDKDGFSIYHQRRDALDHCLANLSEENQQLIKIRYSKSKSVNDIAKEQGKTCNAISKILHRCRMFMLKCISQRINESEAYD